MLSVKDHQVNVLGDASCPEEEIRRLQGSSEGGSSAPLQLVLSGGTAHLVLPDLSVFQECPFLSRQLI